jgi:fused signal recognition particle receptor
MGFFDKLFGKKEKQTLDQGLQKTKESFFTRVGKAIAGKTTVDEEVLDNLEDALVSADVGVDTTIQIIDRIEKRVARDKYMNTAELNGILRDEIEQLLRESGADSLRNFEVPDKKPYVVLVVGVNGAGKTTTIGKLAYNFKKAGYSVLLGAADTFRAAATDQLNIWSERAGVPIVRQGMGADPASVAFDTVQSGLSRGTDVIIVDTAGRLHNKTHLMEELSKINRVMKKLIPDAPHEVLLVLDGSTGQNALAIASQFKIPVKYIGVGEKIEDLLLFDSHEFVDSLFKDQVS